MFAIFVVCVLHNLLMLQVWKHFQMNMAIYHGSDIFFNIKTMVVNKLRTLNLLMGTIMQNCPRVRVRIVTVV